MMPLSASAKRMVSVPFLALNRNACSSKYRNKWNGSTVTYVPRIDRFNRLAELADAVHLGGRLTPEDEEFLKDCQQKDR